MPFQITIDRDADIEALGPKDVRKAIDERSEFLHNIFAEAGETFDPANVKTVDVKDGSELAAQIRNRNEELTKLGKRQSIFDEMDSIRATNERVRNTPDGPNPSSWAPRNGPANQPAAKPWTVQFSETEVFKNAQKRIGNQKVDLPVDPMSFLGNRPINASFLTSAGWAPETTRTGRVVLDEQREIEVTDILPLFPTNQAAIKYMEETTFTNNAAERAESASYVESALVLTEKSVSVQSIGTSLPVSDEQLDDVDGVNAYLDSRLGFMVRQRLDSQILVGDGSTPNLRGTLNVSGINTQAKGTDSVPDAIYKAMDLVRYTGRAIPNVAIIHPTDWQPVRLLKTVDGVYIWGSPSDAGPARIWGIPVVLTTAVTQNTGIVGDYARFSGLHIRKALEVLTGFVNNDFLQGRVTIRAGLRCAVVHYRPSAFTQITGI
jgi:HK97 family phage major capsid protein